MSSRERVDLLYEGVTNYRVAAKKRARSVILLVIAYLSINLLSLNVNDKIRMKF
jgi:hypothetical protein